MAKNENLHKAKDAKNDEFYTQYSDIEAEMNAYVEFNPDVFRGKTILLPCDDPEWSNFNPWERNSSWATSPEKVQAELIGTAIATEPGVVCASFKAG